VDFKHITRLHLGLANVAQVFHTAIQTHHAIDARLPAIAARHTEGPMDSTVGQDAGSHRLQKAHAARTTVTTVPASRPTRTCGPFGL
jgi:hypothetical protein